MFQVPASQDIKLEHKEIDQILKRAQVRPLAVGVHNDRQLLKFCYTSEVADSALKILDEAGLPGELRLRHGLALVAMVGAGVTRNPLHCHRFWEELKGQPVEFTWQSDDGISLLAVLRTGPTESLIQGRHQSVFSAEKRIGRVLFGKGNIGSRWLELFAREQSTLSARTGFEFVLAGVVDSRRSLLSYDGLDAGLSGIFSGTLSWLFLQFDGTVPFTDLVDQAWQQGLTEPDPRVDLSGKDVMRKLVILAREAGYDIEPDQVRVESLVPAHCEEGSVDHFFENGEELNEQMLQRLEAAREMGLVLRYVARFDANGKARVGVEAVREEHPLAALLPCDNVFAIESRWYRDNPLVIRGPGAGRDVTAGAIQSDINRLAQLL